jgi:hypothetical protein
MSSELAQYRQLERHLWLTRWRKAGDESEEEDVILDEMEAAWQKLSEDERVLLTREGPRCWPMEHTTWPPNLANTTRPFATRSRYYEVFTSTADTILSADAA